jgi:hypothetical protein
MFQKDETYASRVGTVFGEYVTTFTSSPTGEVRADLFRRGTLLEAYVSFPTGLDAGSVTEPYVTALWEYAREHGAADHFRLLLS